VAAYAATGSGSPPELAGVPKSDWPDACSIAPGYTERSGSYDPRQDDLFVGSIRIRRNHCVFGEGKPADVAIVWVAGTPAEAQSLLNVHPSDEDVRTLRLRGVDTAYSLDHELWIRAGRYIVRFYGDDPARRKLAQAVAKTLRKR
jgi:hypothetical protein